MYNLCFILWEAGGKFIHQFPFSCLHTQKGLEVLPETPGEVQPKALVCIHIPHHSFLHLQLSLPQCHKLMLLVVLESPLFLVPFMFPDSKLSERSWSHVSAEHGTGHMMLTFWSQLWNWGGCLMEKWHTSWPTQLALWWNLQFKMLGLKETWAQLKLFFFYFS